LAFRWKRKRNGKTGLDRLETPGSSRRSFRESAFPANRQSSRETRGPIFPKPGALPAGRFENRLSLQAVDRATETPPEIFPKPGLLPSRSFRELALPESR